MKKRWPIAATAALLALVCWAAWYVRPITIHDLGLDTKPDVISIIVIRNSSGSDIENQSLRLEEGDPDFQPVLERLEGLRFHRYPTNPLLQAMPSLEGLGGKRLWTIDGYEYHIYINMKNPGASDWTVPLSCDVDAWSYRDYQHGVSLPLYISHAHETAKALGDELWEIALQGKVKL